MSPQDVLVPPSFLNRPAGTAKSLVTQVVKVYRAIGLEMEPEQALGVDVLTSMKANGLPAALEAVVISPRQNLKTFDLEGIVLTRMLNPRDPSRMFVWTAQQLDTEQETFLHFKEWFESDNFPFLKSRLIDVSNGKGSEEIEIGVVSPDGRLIRKRLKFKARSKKAGRGLTGDVVVLDEAFALEPAHMGALLPTLSTRRHATVLYGSSAGHADSEILRSKRDRGRLQDGNRIAYIEWCGPGSFDKPGCDLPSCSHIPGVLGCALDRRESIQLANPMAGRRITWEYLEDERLSLPPMEYGRERHGWWDEPAGGGAPPVTVEDWRVCTDPESKIPADAPVVLAAEIALDRKSGSIGVAGWRTDGAAHVELIDHRNGTDWLLPALLGYIGRNTLHQLQRGKELCPAVVIDPTSPAGTLVDPLKKAGIQPVLMVTREAGVAAAGLQDAVTDRTVFHRGQVAVETALSGAVRRDLGDGGWAFGRKKSAAGSVDITPLVVVTNARWALTEATEPDAGPAFAFS